MAEPFPDTPFFRGNYAPIGIECDAPDLPVRGTIPPALRGTLFRNGPNPQYAPRDPKAHHWFLGDGMLHAFRIRDGRVAYRNRWVRTPRWQAEHAAGRALFGAMGNPMAADLSVRGVDSGVANTSVVWHAGRLLALEEAHRPFEVDPATLESLGYRDFGGALAVPRFTAHPKLDPETGQMLFFAYGLGGPLGAGMAYGAVDAAGRLTRCDAFDAPYAAMVHDFLVTRRHVLFPVLPLTGSLKRAMAGGPAFAWEPEAGAFVGILRRGDPIGALRWFQGDPCYVFHVMNAWEEGETILADVMQSRAAPLFPRADGTWSTDPAEGAARLHRWRFDLGAGTDCFTATPLDDLPGEFPRIDERFAGLPNRIGFFAAGTRPNPGAAFDSLVRIEPGTGTRRLFTVPPGDAVSEPVFVPRAPDAPEGEGWLLAVAFRGEEQRSDLLVLDAADPAAGPVAVAMLPHRVPHGFHGAWRAEAA